MAECQHWGAFMHNSRWRLFLLATIILLPGVGFSKEALTFKQALDKYTGSDGKGLYRCATTARIVGTNTDECRMVFFWIRTAAGYSTPPLGKIDDAAAWAIIEDVLRGKKPTRFIPLGREKSLRDISSAVASILDNGHPDFYMINCLSALEYQGVEDSLSCNYAYAKVMLLLSCVADLGDYKVSRVEFPYVLQQSLEQAYSRSKTPQP
jgi:hypothetical protein